MKKVISVFLVLIIVELSVVFGIKTLPLAKAVENQIISFVDNTVDIIQKNDAGKEFIVESENEISTCSTDSTSTSNYDFQTRRLIVQAKKEIDKLNSTDIASGFKDFYIVQFANESDAKDAFEYYSNCKYVISVSPDRVYNAISKYSVGEDNEITYESDTPARLESWGSIATGMYELKDYIESNYDVSTLSKITVAVIDSGVDLNHEFLQNRLISTGYNSTDDGQVGSEHNVLQGHGTTVASVIADNTPSNVKIKSYRVTDDDGYTTSAIIGVTIIKAYLEDDANLINISLCCAATSESEWNLFKASVQAAYEANCVIVTGAGNYNVDIDYHNSIPASCDLVITAAASNETNFPTSWSSRGNSVDVMAPGENIPVATPKNKYKLVSGTSYSSPLTVSLIALLKTLYPEESIKQLEVRMESTANACDLEGVVNMYGYGIIDAIGAAGLKRTETPIINNEYDIYEGIANIKISVPRNAVVYYTMDQTYPSRENGTLYTDSITITDDIFRIHAVAYSDDGFRSDYASELIRVSTNVSEDMFDISNDGTVTAYYGNVNYLNVPENIDGIKVIGFAEKVFSDTELYGVVFPDSIQTISSNLFYGNSTLQYADGKGITEIQAGAFYNCTNLYEVNFPEVLSVGKRAFYNTRQLSGIDFSKCTYIDQYAFYNSIIRYANLPEAKTICAYAFQECGCLYEFNVGSLTELRERLYTSGKWQLGGFTFQEAELNCIIDLKNTTTLPYGTLYQAQVKRLEFSKVKSIASLPISYCKKPYYGTITVVLPSTLESCDIDDIPYYDEDIPYEIKYKVYGTLGTYAESWAKDNGYEFIPITAENPNDAIITDLPEEYYSYMNSLEADVVGFNRTYQWYGTNTESYDNAQLLQSGDKKRFEPNEHKQYKYYFCKVTSKDGEDFESIEITTGICENKSYKPYSPPTSNGRVTIATPSNRYLKYGESINLYANATGLPEGSKIKWRIVEGSGVTLDPSVSGAICTVTSKSNGNVIIEAYAVNKYGNTIVNEKGNRICDKEGIGSEVSLWWIILYLIKQMFGITKTAMNFLL